MRVTKRIIELGKHCEYGTMVTYSLFPGIIIAFMDIDIEDADDVFVEEKVDSRLLEINHCANGRYAYSVGDDKVIYFGPGDLCISIYDLTKTASEFPLGYYEGVEIFIDVDVANEYVKEYIQNFDLIEFYETLEKNGGFVMVRSNDKIDHVIGELYSVDERINESYYKLKCLELLLFFSITNFTKDESISLSKRQVKIVENVKNDLIENLESKILIFDEPTSGLDLKNMMKVSQNLVYLQKLGITSFIITHDFELIMQACSHILHLENGKIVDNYQIDEEKLKKFFLNSKF